MVVCVERRSQELCTALSRSLSRATWLSKDLFFINVNGSYAGQSAVLRKWLDAYHLNANADLVVRAGPIRAAIVLDWDSATTERLAVLLHGHNGKLPNLDLFNVVQRISKNFGLEQVLSIFTNPSDDSNNRAITSLLFARDAIWGSTGLHGEFLQYGIDALTIRGTRAKRTTHSTQQLIPARTMAAITELTIRSMSNTDEKLHQSFFFYFLISPTLFVSVDEYLWALVVFLLPWAMDSIYVTMTPTTPLSGFNELKSVASTFAVAVLFCGVIIPRLVFFMGEIWFSMIWWFTCAFTVKFYNENNSCSWRYRQASVELLCFISLVALGVVHFPLALASALIVYLPVGAVKFAKQANKPSILRKAVSLMLRIYCAMVPLLLVRSSLVKCPHWRPTAAGGGAEEDVFDLNVAVLTWIVLPSFAVISTVLWERPVAPIQSVKTE